MVHGLHPQRLCAARPVTFTSGRSEKTLNENNNTRLLSGCRRTLSGLDVTT